LSRKKKKERDEALFIEDMIIAAENVLEFTRELTFDDFEDDNKTTSAVMYNLQIIGEGASKVSLKTRTQHPEINWRAMKAFRNYAAHEYFGVSLKIVWGVIRKNLTDDLNNLRLILSEIKSSEISDKDQL
jgi:uncharacterized protein with HEPN domain